MHFEGMKRMIEFKGGITAPCFEGTRALGGVVLLVLPTRTLHFTWILTEKI